MNFWIAFWTVFLVVGLVLYAGLIIVITVGGFFDVRALLRRQRVPDTETDRTAPQDRAD